MYSVFGKVFQHHNSHRHLVFYLNTNILVLMQHCKILARCSPELYMILFSREKSTNQLPQIVTTFKYVDMSNRHMSVE